MECGYKTCLNADMRSTMSRMEKEIGSVRKRESERGRYKTNVYRLVTFLWADATTTPLLRPSTECRKPSTSSFSLLPQSFSPRHHRLTLIFYKLFGPSFSVFLIKIYPSSSTHNVFRTSLSLSLASGLTSRQTAFVTSFY